MKTELKFIHFTYKTLSAKEYNIPLSYQLFGKDLFSAPIILVNHALTGNSDVSGEKGWWKKLIGEGQVIITAHGYVGARAMPPKGGRQDLSIEPNLWQPELPRKIKA